MLIMFFSQFECFTVIVDITVGRLLCLSA